ncbi:AhpC/TSA antioxidant enzyme-domain-containing protein [Tribonema minus]|uniref:AhpC/TSA antioxidant enzyme-domain-containing protein n=1 Tax=Tribonema minus TaxID=303371 RepID=A0A835Z7Y9_9STRA|nr:AhpC/TSA antioxidant enzyme-domain-containing protein [Tribonema minus]
MFALVLTALSASAVAFTPAAQPGSASPLRIASNRGALRLLTVASSSTVSSRTGASETAFDVLSEVNVLSAATGQPLPLTQAWKAKKGKKTVVAFLTHFADFNAWEYAQKLRHYLPAIDDAGAEVIAVGLGTVAAAKEFASLTNFPLQRLYVDETGRAYEELGFSKGFQPPVKVNPYLKLLPMLAGIGSPGTIQAVLRGYVGDRDADASWVESTLQLVEKRRFDVLGTQGARPFEVATVRLQNMREIVTRWDDLSPPNKELITWQGGTLIFDGKEVVYQYNDRGILTYTPVDEVLREVGAKP